MVSRDKNGFSGFTCLLFISLGVHIIGYVNKSFYNKQLFYKNLDKIADWVGRTCSLDINDTIWDTFYSKQIFRNYKSHCNKIINCIANKESLAIPNLDLLQESYINGVLEKQYNIEMPFNQEKYFTNTTEIIKHLCLK